MNDSVLIGRILRVVLAMRNFEPILEEDMSEDFSEGYRQGLDDLAQWLMEEFALTWRGTK